MPTCLLETVYLDIKTLFANRNSFDLDTYIFLANALLQHMNVQVVCNTVLIKEFTVVSHLLYRSRLGL